MKNKVLFIISILISILISGHLFVIGFYFENEIILGVFSNGNTSSISKLSLMLFISIIMVLYFLIIIPNYIKEKKINDNLFMAYLIFEIILNILPYFGK